MDSDWLNHLANKFAEKQIRVIRFEFPYMQERRLTDTKRPPNTAKILKQHWLEVISSHKERPLFIGDKSLGARMASLVADQAGVSGLICLGFPFHAPGKLPGDRITHLESLKTPTLICQGERDPFGKPEEVGEYSLSKKFELEWISDGDHSFKPRKKSGLNLDQNMCAVVDKIAAFISNN